VSSTWDLLPGSKQGAPNRATAKPSARR
jgi:hypothetical protein